MRAKVQEKVAVKAKPVMLKAELAKATRIGKAIVGKSGIREATRRIRTQIINKTQIIARRANDPLKQRSGLKLWQRRALVLAIMASVMGAAGFGISAAARHVYQRSSRIYAELRPLAVPGWLQERKPGLVDYRAAERGKRAAEKEISLLAPWSQGGARAKPAAGKLSETSAGKLNEASAGKLSESEKRKTKSAAK